MHIPLAALLNRIDSPSLTATSVIRWGAPVPAFGDPSKSAVATVGLNPSNREFVDDAGNELRDGSRRFHTLQSLCLESWLEADARHLDLICESCHEYFRNNPYDRWFKKLDQIVAGTATSFYSALHPACHLDLVPYATSEKWMDLEPRERAALLSVNADALGILLRDSPIHTLILNGRSVVEQFQQIAGIRLDAREMTAWSLPRESGARVAGFSYDGQIDQLAGIPLHRKVTVLGYNHNIQSSFGVTKQVIEAIRDWLAEKTAGARR